jgi:hypothetical protein
LTAAKVVHGSNFSVVEKERAIPQDVIEKHATDKNLLLRAGR